MTAAQLAARLPVGECDAADVAANDRETEAGGVPRQPLQLLLGAVEKALLFDQVAGRITVDGEFGENSQLRAAFGGLARRAQDQRGVSLKISDCGIDLRQRDPHLNSYCTEGCGEAPKRRSAGREL